MTTRITTKTVVFSRAFVLNEADGEQQPGVYTVETEEEELESCRSRPIGACRPL